MSKNKHLNLDDRSKIQLMLDNKESFTSIASALGKDPTTISKEIRNHLRYRRAGAYHLPYNSCTKRGSCPKSHICTECHAARKYTLCRRCSMCNSLCKDFEKETCKRLLKPPYVCNGCGKRSVCSLEKRVYNADFAHREYRDILSESRTGLSYSEEEIRFLDEFVSPLIRKKQSPHHICATNADSLTISERTIYRLIDARIISAMNIDLPRKVRYNARKVERPDLAVIQLDSVEGKKGSKVLLTIHFVKAELMLAFLRDHNDSRSVIDIFERLFLELRPDRFCTLFKVCLADNGTEFSNPKAIEYDHQGKLRTRIFYCDPGAPYQKGSAERNHEFIRCFLPKGTDFSSCSQEDICLMMDHINSYSRESLGNKCPYDVFSFLYGQEILDLLGCHRVPPQDVTLNRSIFHKEDNSHESR